MRRTLLAAAVLVIALAACSDDDDGVATDTTTTSDASTSTSAATPSTTAAPQTTTSGGATASSTVASGKLECGTVGFTPNSEDVASSITVSGGTCEEAKAFVEVAGMLTSSGGPAAVDVRGYKCVRTRSENDPLPAATYSCTRAGTTITFVRT